MIETIELTYISEISSYDTKRLMLRTLRKGRSVQIAQWKEPLKLVMLA